MNLSSKTTLLVVFLASLSLVHSSGVQMLLESDAQSRIPFHSAAPKTYKVTQKPIGVHLDVEPPGLPQMSRADFQKAATEYLNMFDVVRTAIKDAGFAGQIQINCDIARWYYEVTSKTNMDVTIGSVTKPLNQWVIDKADRVTIMDYQNTLPNILAGAEPHITYATNTYHGKKQIVIALDVHSETEDQDTISFFGMKVGDLESAITGIKNEFNGQSGFGGVAIWEHKFYTELSGVAAQVIPRTAATQRDVYNYDDYYFTQDQEMTDLLKFTNQHNIRSIYYQSTNGVMNDQAGLAAFLNNAKLQDMSVELLAGQVAWGTTAGQAKGGSLLTYIKQVTDFYASLTM